ncbi:MAG: C-GCAxxG-C-C family protein [Planctomycetaceae bacterium]|nr:C-GCAxxG-C-C family protein [Planctomycetaceae bacterium]
MTQSIKRREMLTGLGAGTLLSFGLIGRETKAADDLAAEIDFWKYAKTDPAKAADLAYEIYPDGGCMIAAVRSLLTTIADILQTVNPMAASVMMTFPFHMMRYGSGGVGGIGSTCGAFNGGAAVIGLFVKDAASRSAMIQELCTYYEQMELPIYKPKDDEFPRMETVVPESVLCHISSTRWRIAADTKMFSPKREERCRRLTADIVAKTAELLNRYYADKTCTFAPLTQPTTTCFDCHGSQGTQADAISKMDCATCHDHGDTHINTYINMKK